MDTKIKIFIKMISVHASFNIPNLSLRMLNISKEIMHESNIGIKFQLSISKFNLFIKKKTQLP